MTNPKSSDADPAEINSDLGAHNVTDFGPESLLESPVTDEEFVERSKRLRQHFGVPSESCHSKQLGLQRFRTAEKLKLPKLKTLTEQILNPFGDPWASKKRQKNRFIPVITSSAAEFLRRERGALADPLASDPSFPSPLTRDFSRYAKSQASVFHYDETLARLAPDMKRYQQVKTLYAEHRIPKRFIGYAVLNYDDHTLFPKGTPLPEHFYMHLPESSQRPEDRLNFTDGSTLIASGHVFDIRKPDVRKALVDAVERAMVQNELDAVLIDYAVRRYAFGSPELLDELPKEWFQEFQEHQFKLVCELYERLKSSGKLLFLNGVMLDSIIVTEPKLINLFIKHCDGMMWEQPFRWEWRDYQNGEIDYYERLQSFFDLCAYYKRRLIVKTGTYRFHATEDIESGWNKRFVKTNYGIEEHLALYNTAFFLLYYNRHFSNLMHSHPTEVWDVFTSQAHFKFWDIPIGEALSSRIEYGRHVHYREFENAFVFVNNTLKPFRISAKRKCPVTGHRLPHIKLRPFSGRIWIKPSGRVNEMKRSIGSVLQPRRRLQALLGGPTKDDE